MPLSTQHKRVVRLETRLGKDAFIVNMLNGYHAMSDNFHYTLDVISEAFDAVPCDQLLGTPATFVVMDQDDNEIYYNGVIMNMSRLGMGKDRSTLAYRLTIESALSLLDQKANCRIFQNVSVPEVLLEIIKPLKRYAYFKEITRFVSELKTDEKRTYITQYNETDLNFFKRLCKAMNIAYFFEFENGRHFLRMVNSGICCLPLEDDKNPIKLQPDTHDHDHLTSWSEHARVIPGKFSQATYHYRYPTHGSTLQTQNLKGEKAKLPHNHDFEIYTNTEGYKRVNAGEHVQRALLRGTERQRVFRASGDCRFLNVGKLFKVQPVPDTFLVVAKDEVYTSTRVEITADVTSGTVKTSLEAVPVGDLVYPKGEKPVMHSQSAVVTGLDGNEITTDELGRVKVKFFWDRREEPGAGFYATCFLRVMQPMTGSNMGVQFTPRHGDEVIVEFTNGDPDRPYIAGAMHHQLLGQPYKDFNGRRNGIRTRSTPDGGFNNYNELYFDDTKGREQVYIQAEKDNDRYVKNDENSKIDRNQNQHVGNNQNNLVGKNYNIEVGENLVMQAGKSITLQVAGTSITITADKIDISSLTT